MLNCFFQVINRILSFVSIRELKELLGLSLFRLKKNHSCIRRRKKKPKLHSPKKAKAAVATFPAKKATVAAAKKPKTAKPDCLAAKKKTPATDKPKATKVAAAIPVPSPPVVSPPEVAAKITSPKVAPATSPKKVAPTKAAKAKNRATLKKAPAFY